MPLFTRADAEVAISLLKPVARHEWYKLSENLQFEFGNAGHIVGASFIRVHVSHGQRNQVICFSGDVGNDRHLTIREPEALAACDTLLLESTYGDRRQPRHDTNAVLAQLLSRVIDRNGVVIIPAFAVGRAQELLVRIATLERLQKIKKAPVILDSPMAAQATQMFLEQKADHHPNLDANEAAIFPPFF